MENSLFGPDRMDVLARLRASGNVRPHVVLLIYSSQKWCVGRHRRMIETMRIWIWQQGSAVTLLDGRGLRHTKAESTSSYRRP